MTDPKTALTRRTMDDPRPTIRDDETDDPTVIVATTQGFERQFVSADPMELVRWADEQDGLVHVSIQPAYHAN